MNVAYLEAGLLKFFYRPSSLYQAFYKIIGRTVRGRIVPGRTVPKPFYCIIYSFISKHGWQDASIYSIWCKEL